jgi:hypothetical protein
MQPGGNALLAQQPPESRAGFIRADDGEQAHRRAERCGIARNVGRATGTFLDAIDSHDRDRGFR